MPHRDHPLRTADVRERNAKLVLRLIRAAGKPGLSQAEAVTATGLRAPTIFRIFSGLEEEGFLRPLPNCPEARDEGRKGRPRVCYGVRAEARYYLGAEFWLDRISMGLFDFSGALVSREQLAVPEGVDADGIAASLVGMARGLLASHAVGPERFLGLGVGAPGQVNVRAGRVVYYARIPGMRDYPLAAALESALGAPALLHNNCSVIALAESRYSGLDGADALFMFLLRSGVNGSFVSSAGPYLASDGSTIETGHVVVRPDGTRCSCGSRGCLEAELGACDPSGELRGRWLFDGPAAKAPPTREAGVAKAAPYLAAATRTMARLYRPKAFLYLAATAELAAAVRDAVKAELESYPSGFDDAATAFHAGAYDDGLALRGAADLVTDAYLS